MTPQEIADTMSPEEIEIEIQKSRKELEQTLARIKGRNAATALIKWLKIFLFWYGVYSFLKWVF